jgi:hypothetical protein
MKMAEKVTPEREGVKKGPLTNDDDGRRHECPDEEEEDEGADDDAQPLDQVHVRDLDGLGGTDAENDGNSGKADQGLQGK